MSDGKFCVELEDDHDPYDRLLRIAVEHARKIASSDSKRAREGFGFAVRDERDRLLFEVSFGPRMRPVLH